MEIENPTTDVVTPDNPSEVFSLARIEQLNRIEAKLDQTLAILAGAYEYVEKFGEAIDELQHSPLGSMIMGMANRSGQ